MLEAWRMYRNSYAGCIQGGAETGGGVGGNRRGEVLPEGRGKRTPILMLGLSAWSDEQTPCFYLPTSENKGSSCRAREDRELT